MENSSDSESNSSWVMLEPEKIEEHLVDDEPIPEMYPDLSTPEVTQQERDQEIAQQDSIQEQQQQENDSESDGISVITDSDENGDNSNESNDSVEDIEEEAAVQEHLAVPQRPVRQNDTIMNMVITYVAVVMVAFVAAQVFRETHPSENLKGAGNQYVVLKNDSESGLKIDESVTEKSAVYEKYGDEYKLKTAKSREGIDDDDYGSISGKYKKPDVPNDYPEFENLKIQNGNAEERSNNRKFKREYEEEYADNGQGEGRKRIKIEPRKQEVDTANKPTEGQNSKREIESKKFKSEYEKYREIDDEKFFREMEGEKSYRRYKNTPFLVMDDEHKKVYRNYIGLNNEARERNMQNNRYNRYRDEGLVRNHRRERNAPKPDNEINSYAEMMDTSEEENSKYNIDKNDETGYERERWFRDKKEQRHDKTEENNYEGEKVYTEDRKTNGRDGEAVSKHGKSNFKNHKENFKHERENYMDGKANYKDGNMDYQDKKPNYKGRKPNYRDAKPHYNDRKADYKYGKDNYKDGKRNYKDGKSNFQDRKRNYKEQASNHKEETSNYEEEKRYNNEKKSTYKKERSNFKDTKPKHKEEKSYFTDAKSRYKETKANHKNTNSNYKETESSYKDTKANIKATKPFNKDRKQNYKNTKYNANPDFKDSKSKCKDSKHNYKDANPDFKTTNPDYKYTKSNYKLTKRHNEDTNPDHQGAKSYNEDTKSNNKHPKSNIKHTKLDSEDTETNYKKAKSINRDKQTIYEDTDSVCEETNSKYRYTKSNFKSEKSHVNGKSDLKLDNRNSKTGSKVYAKNTRKIAKNVQWEREKFLENTSKMSGKDNLHYEKHNGPRPFRADKNEKRNFDTRAHGEFTSNKHSAHESASKIYGSDKDRSNGFTTDKLVPGRSGFLGNAYEGPCTKTDSGLCVRYQSVRSNDDNVDYFDSDNADGFDNGDATGHNAPADGLDFEEIKSYDRQPKSRYKDAELNEKFSDECIEPSILECPYYEGDYYGNGDDYYEYDGDCEDSEIGAECSEGDHGNYRQAEEGEDNSGRSKDSKRNKDSEHNDDSERDDDYECYDNSESDVNSECDVNSGPDNDSEIDGECSHHNIQESRKISKKGGFKSSKDPNSNLKPLSKEPRKNINSDFDFNNEDYKIEKFQYEYEKKKIQMEKDELYRNMKLVDKKKLVANENIGKKFKVDNVVNIYKNNEHDEEDSYVENETDGNEHDQFESEASYYQKLRDNKANDYRELEKNKVDNYGKIEQKKGSYKKLDQKKRNYGKLDEHKVNNYENLNENKASDYKKRDKNMNNKEKFGSKSDKFEIQPSKVGDSDDFFIRDEDFIGKQHDAYNYECNPDDYDECSCSEKDKKIMMEKRMQKKLESHDDKKHKVDNLGGRKQFSNEYKKSTNKKIKITDGSYAEKDNKGSYAKLNKVSEKVRTNSNGSKTKESTDSGKNKRNTDSNKTKINNKIYTQTKDGTNNNKYGDIEKEKDIEKTKDIERLKNIEKSKDFGSDSKLDRKTKDYDKSVKNEAKKSVKNTKSKKETKDNSQVMGPKQKPHLGLRNYEKYLNQREKFLIRKEQKLMKQEQKLRDMMEEEEEEEGEREFNSEFIEKYNRIRHQDALVYARFKEQTPDTIPWDLMRQHYRGPTNQPEQDEEFLNKIAAEMKRYEKIVPKRYGRNKENESLNGEWYTNMHEERNKIRKENMKPNWYLERANMRNKKRNKALWYFNLMSNREDNRFKNRRE